MAHGFDGCAGPLLHEGKLRLGRKARLRLERSLRERHLHAGARLHSHPYRDFELYCIAHRHRNTHSFTDSRIFFHLHVHEDQDNDEYPDGERDRDKNPVANAVAHFDRLGYTHPNVQPDVQCDSHPNGH
jgi:hypothetical protein